MKSEKVTYGRLERILRRLGYVPEVRGRLIVFRHPNAELPVVLRSMSRAEVLMPADLLSARNAIVNGGIATPKEVTSLLEEDEPLSLWHDIIDAEANYLTEFGHTPRVLKLPVRQAYDLAKLPQEDLGELSGQVMREGIGAFEKVGLLNVPVKLVQDDDEFSFE